MKTLKRTCLFTLMIVSSLIISACAKQQAPNECKASSCLESQAVGVWDSSNWDQATWQ